MDDFLVLLAMVTDTILMAFMHVVLNTSSNLIVPNEDPSAFTPEEVKEGIWLEASLGGRANADLDNMAHQGLPTHHVQSYDGALASAPDSQNCRCICRIRFHSDGNPLLRCMVPSILRILGRPKG